MPEFELAPLDLLMVGLYVVFIAGIGFYFARPTKTTDDYFLAGHRPQSESVRGLTWSAALFRDEPRALQGLPWYMNYRYQVLGLIALMAGVACVFR